MSCFLDENRCFYKFKLDFFVKWPIKFLKFRVVIQLVSNLMLNYSTYIYLSRVY